MAAPDSGCPMAEPVPTNRRPVIFCADDFAINASVSLGISRLARMGRLSATSAMVLSPRWASDAALLQDLRGKIDVGLHLDWTSDFAVAEGHGMALGRAMRQGLLGAFGAGQAGTVIERQLDLFEQHWQAPPDFVDGHQHVQQFAGIRDALVAALVRRYGKRPDRPYLRISRAPRGMADLKSRVIAGMGAKALEAAATAADVRTANGLLGVYDFSGGPQRYADLMTRWLAQAPSGAILMCHPAQAAEPEDAIGIARTQEFSYLASHDFPLALHLAGVQVARGCVALPIARIHA